MVTVNDSMFDLPPLLNLKEVNRVVRSNMSENSLPTKGSPWTNQEHLQFLKGLQAFGKGQWKQISRVYVPTRTPTQVASHAQKHFLRCGGQTKGRRSRFTSVEEKAVATGLVASVTGESDGVCPTVPSFPMPVPSLHHTLQHPTSLPPPIIYNGRHLPILPVIPGRIHAATSTLIRRPVIKKTDRHTLPSSVARKAQLFKLLELEEKLRSKTGGVEDAKPTMTPPLTYSKGNLPTSESGTTSNSGLDALAGIAVALADRSEEVVSF